MLFRINNLGCYAICPLTTGADFEAAVGAGSINVNGLLANNGGSNTWQTWDTISGGSSSNDTLTAELRGGTVVMSNVSSIENINLNVSNAAQTIDAVGATYIRNIDAVSDQALTINNLASLPTVSLSSTALTTINFDTAALVGANTLNLSLSGGQTGGITITDDGTAALETVAITSSGDNETVLTTTLLGATTLSVSGSGNLTTTIADTQGTLLTVNASGSTGNNSFTVLGASTVTGGSGNDTVIQGAAGNDNLFGGAGNDNFSYTAAVLTADDTINGGDGVDTLTVATSAMVNTAGITTPFTRITNVETLSITGAIGAGETITTANVATSINRVNVNAANAGAATLNMGSGSATVGLNVAGALVAGSLLTVDSAGVGTSDSLTVLNMRTATDNIGSTTSDLTVTDFETVTINLGTYGANVTQNLRIVNVGSTNALSLTGNNTLALAGGVTAASLDASGMTGTGALTMNAAATSVTSITGTANADILRGDASSSISGGAGNDTIFGGTGNDTLRGGDGVDTITTNTGSDSVDGGAGNDIIVLESNLTSADTIDGGDGVDTISITNITATAISTAAGARVSNVETLRFDGAGALVQDLNVFSGTTLTAITNNVGQSLTVSNASADISAVNFTGADGATIIITREVDTTTNALTVTNASDIVATALTANDEETLVLTSSAAGAVAVGITTLTASDLTTLTVSGNKAYSVGTLTAANLASLTIDASQNVDLGDASTNALTSINSSAAGGTVRIIAASNLANLTLTAGNGAHTVTSGSGADVLAGGDGADSFTGGLGNDTVSGNAGNDTIVAGAGVDVLSGGTGTDTLQTGTVASYGNDGGASAVLGLVINAGTAALLETTIDNYVQFAGANNISADLLGIAASSLGRIGAVNTVSNRISAIDTFEVFVGSDGTDYIVGSSAANTITGGLGADIVSGGTGATVADVFFQTAGDSVVATASIGGFDTAAALGAAASTITFANGIDVITDFNVAVDIIDQSADVDFDGYITTTVGTGVLGATIAIRGDFVIGTGVFTYSTTGADALVVINKQGATGNLVLANIADDAVIFMGVAGDLTAANFIA